MAIEEQVKLLKEKRVAAWNQWRKRNSETIPDLRGADLIDADLSSADLRGANLSRANLSKANLRQADLRGANLIWADLSDASLIGAEFNGADLASANLNRALLRRADLWRVRMGDTSLGDVDLSEAKRLETVIHMAPSSIGIDTIYSSKGRIPEVFLRGAGVPEPFIANMKALVAAMEPIQFYSCFISYSSKDQEFADRLHADLQQKQVRCWFAPEDLKIGDKFRTKIDEAIRIHDKLLLMLTESSVKSTWVEKEVETAFEKERKQGGRCCFRFDWMMPWWRRRKRGRRISGGHGISGISAGGRRMTSTRRRLRG